MIKQNYDAVIIGGGHNGLVCSFYLANAGLKVKVLERRNIVGGAAVTEEFHPGFRNSTASYTVSLLNPTVIKDMQLKENGLEIIKRPISNFLPINDTDYLKVGGSLESTQKEFQKFSNHDANVLPEYYRRIENVADVLRDLTTKTPLNLKGGYFNIAKTIFDLVPIARKTNELQEDLFNLFTKSAKDFLDAWFENDHVKACFGFDSIVGNYASPETPGSAYVLLHHVFGEVDGEKGAWGHAVGGMGSITQLMKNACEAKGVEISTNASVESVIIEDNNAKGVMLEDGKKIFANKVISNLNPKLLFKKLVSESDVDPDYLRKILNYKCGSGTFRMNVALSELPNFSCLPGKEVGEHHKSGIVIAPSLTYMDQAFTEAKQYGWSKNPIVEMLIPSTVDDSLAPEGKHVASLFCQQFAPKLPDNRSWHDEKNNAADTIIETVNRFAPNFKESVLGRSILSPLDLEEKLGLIGGDIMHGVMSLDQMWAARPVFNYGDYKTPVKNLFICGSGTHPGGGVTGLPGKNSSREILKA